MSILEDAINVYSSLLKNDKVAQDYLKNVRGFSEEAVEAFSFGSTGVPGQFYGIMRNEYKYTDEQLENSGLIFINGKARETFRDSIIIPMKDIQGRVINMTARNINKKMYINLPHVQIHDFFGLEAIELRHTFRHASKNYVFICEGQMDTLIMRQKHLMALGILGVNNIRENMFQHLSLFDNIILAMDNDGPGDRATRTLANNIAHYCPSCSLWKIDMPKGINDINILYLENGLNDLFSRIIPIDNINPCPLKLKKSITIEGKSKDLLAIKSIQIAEIVKKAYPAIRFQKKSQYLKSICPFSDHKEDIESFTIYPQTNSYYCWGCGRGGDVIDFVMNFFGVKFKEAVRIIKEWSN